MLQPMGNAGSKKSVRDGKVLQIRRVRVWGGGGYPGGPNVHLHTVKQSMYTYFYSRRKKLVMEDCLKVLLREFIAAAFSRSKLVSIV